MFGDTCKKGHPPLFLSLRQHGNGNQFSGGGVCGVPPFGGTGGVDGVAGSATAGFRRRDLTSQFGTQQLRS